MTIELAVEPAKIYVGDTVRVKAVIRYPQSDKINIISITPPACPLLSYIDKESKAHTELYQGITRQSRDIEYRFRAVSPGKDILDPVVVEYEAGSLGRDVVRSRQIFLSVMPRSVKIGKIALIAIAIILGFPLLAFCGIIIFRKIRKETKSPPGRIPDGLSKELPEHCEAWMKVKEQAGIGKNEDVIVLAAEFLHGLEEFYRGFGEVPDDLASMGKEAREMVEKIRFANFKISQDQTNILIKKVDRSIKRLKEEIHET